MGDLDLGVDINPRFSRIEARSVITLGIKKKEYKLKVAKERKGFDKTRSIEGK